MDELTNITLPVPDVAAPTVPEPCLVLVSSSTSSAVGQVFLLAGRSECVLGRGAEADLRLDDSGISRRHAAFVARPDGDYEVVDLDSRNGVYLNGARVARALLGEGDKIRLGTFTALRFSRRNPLREMRGDEQLRQALAAARTATWSWEAATRQVIWSEQLHQIFALPPGSFAGRSAPLERFVHPDDRERVERAFADALAGGARCDLDYRLLLPDETARWVASQGDVLRDPTGAVVRITGTLVDATERKAQESELRRQALLFESLYDGVVVVGSDGRIADWNASAERIFGFPKEEMLGRSAFELIDPVVAESLRREVAATVARDGRWSRDLDVARKDGSLVACETVVVPLRDVTGASIGLVALYRDISDRKQMQARLLLADRMASVGTLAVGVAHEINNPLAFVVTNMAYLEEQIAAVGERLGAAATEWRQLLRETREGIDRIRVIVNDMKVMSSAHGERERLGPVDVRKVLGFVTKLVENEVRHRARLVRDLAEVPLVEASEARLSQVFLNLLINAAQAIREGDASHNQIRVATRSDGEHVVIEVEDTGSGIPVEIQGRIFDPFFTTKPVGVGTGIGLSVCHGIVTSLGGEIHVDSEPGRGTIFRVVLPRLVRAVTGGSIAAESTAAAPPVGRARVLVVDDEPLIGASIGRYLQREHDVLALVDGREALRLFAAGRRFDVILCDLMMPEMTGIELYAEVSRLVPEQARHIVFITGGAFTPRASRFLDGVPNPKLRKPIDPASLRRTILEVAALSPARVTVDLPTGARPSG